MVLETPTSASGSRDPKLSDLDALATASEGFSGAEIEQAVVAGLTTAFLARRGGQLADHRGGAEGDEAALGHARGDDLRPARVGARADGDGELVRSMTRDCGAGRRGHPLRFDSAPMNRVLRSTAARGAS